jgi:hypothetical protein
MIMTQHVEADLEARDGDSRTNTGQAQSLGEAKYEQGLT